jgi:hypothetical protein
VIVALIVVDDEVWIRARRSRSATCCCDPAPAVLSLFSPPRTKHDDCRKSYDAHQEHPSHRVRLRPSSATLATARDALVEGRSAGRR